MKLIVDNIDSLTGWSATNATVYGLNSFNEFVAGNNSNSAIFQFNNQDGYVEKSYSVDCSEYTDFVIWISSQSLGKNQYRSVDDYNYKIDLGAGKEYYLPVYSEFFYTKINISDIDTIDRIRITALHGNVDHLIVSYALICKDQFPYDVFEGIKEQIEEIIDENITLKNIGTVSGTSGSDTVTFSSALEFVDRYSVVKIDDGVNSEIHQIATITNSSFALGQMYDGTTLQNDYTNANVYLYYPVSYGTTQKEILLPGITFWGFVTTKQMNVTDLDKIIDTVKTDDTYQERQIGQDLMWDILIDCETKEEWEVMEDLCFSVRVLIGRKHVWVNGRKCDITVTAPSVEIYPTESYDVIPKVQYPINIVVREELYTPQVLPKTTTIDVSTTIV